MASQGTPVDILGSTFFVPTQSQSPAWGDELHDTVVALAEAVESLSGPSDIPLTNFQLANNQAVAANVTGASFSVSQVRSFMLNYSIYRSTASNEASEVGVLRGTYSSVAGTWNMSRQRTGTGGITFTITNGGQVQYTSSNLAGSSYSGVIRFKAQAFLQS